MTKYRAVKTTVDGIVFDSRREAVRYQELRLLERAGQITALILQPRLAISVQGVKICEYRGDFEYTDTQTGERILEDVKGVLTPVYRLKKKLVKACYGIDIQEVR